MKRAKIIALFAVSIFAMLTAVLCAVVFAWKNLEVVLGLAAYVTMRDAATRVDKLRGIVEQ